MDVLNRDAVAWLPVRMHTEMYRLGYEYNLCPLQCRLAVGRPFPRRPRKCRPEYLVCWVTMSSSVYLQYDSDCSFTKWAHCDLKPTKLYPSRSVKSLKKKMEKLHRIYVFAPADKAANNVIIIWKRHYVEVLKGELNSTSTYVPAQLTKDQLLVHHINTLTKINVKIDKCELPTFYWLPKLHKRPYKSRFISHSSHCSTTILSKHIQLSKIMLWSTVKLLWAIVMSIIFGPLKTLPRSSKSCDCVTFRVLKYLLSTFLLYTPHCHMIWSKLKCCLWSTGVSTESQNLTSVLHLRQDFLATRNMTRIDVGLARSYVKLLLSSWKTYMCNLMAWYINK